MNGGGQVALGGQAELNSKHLLLQGNVGFIDPPIQADLTDRRRHGIKVALQVGHPPAGALANVPRMAAKTREDHWLLPGKPQHRGPVGFARSVHNHASDALVPAGGQYLVDPRGETAVLQVIVGVVKRHRPEASGLTLNIQRRTSPAISDLEWRETHPRRRRVRQRSAGSSARFGRARSCGSAKGAG